MAVSLEHQHLQKAEATDTFFFHSIIRQLFKKNLVVGVGGVIHVYTKKIKRLFNAYIPSLALKIWQNFPSLGQNVF